RLQRRMDFLRRCHRRRPHLQPRAQRLRNRRPLPRDRRNVLMTKISDNQNLRISEWPSRLFSEIRRFGDSEILVKQWAIITLALLFLFALPAPQARAQDFTTGLVGHWTMDEATGTTVNDST